MSPWRAPPAPTPRRHAPSPRVLPRARLGPSPFRSPSGSRPPPHRPRAADPLRAVHQRAGAVAGGALARGARLVPLPRRPRARPRGPGGGDRGQRARGARGPRQRFAQRTLEVLSAQPDVLAARIWSADGKPFATFRRSMESEPPPRPASDGHTFDDDSVRLYCTLRADGRPIGTVWIQSDLRYAHDRLARYGLILSVVLLGCLLVTFLVAWRLQGVIARPIEELTRAAQAVSSGRDYSVRAVVRGDDEIGFLIAAFNRMLEQIQERDARAARATARTWRSRSRADVRAAKAQRRAARSRRTRARGRDAREERVPGQHEPRDPHADERRDRHDRAAARHRARPPSSASTRRRSATSGESAARPSSTTSSTSRRSRPASSSSRRSSSTCATALEDAVDGARRCARPEGPRAGLLRRRRTCRGPARRPGPAAPGAAQPGRQRGQVHRRGRGRASSVRRSSRSRRRSGAAAFAVSDTGIGIPPETQATALPALLAGRRSTTRRYGGTGLGLAISQQLVELMGGAIGVESEPGQGTHVLLHRPSSRTAEPLPGAARSPTDAGRAARAGRRRQRDQPRASCAQQLDALGLPPRRGCGGPRRCDAAARGASAGGPSTSCCSTTRCPDWTAAARRARSARDPALGRRRRWCC